MLTHKYGPPFPLPLEDRQFVAFPRFTDIALLDSGELLPLPLTIGEYVRTALRWYGAWGWQFLYLSPADFRALHGSTLVTLYKLRNSLPELFPHADWSIIDEKRDYFDWAKKYKR